jgi:hypothetical protein
MPVITLKKFASWDIINAKVGCSKWIKIPIILILCVQFFASCGQSSNTTATTSEQKILNDIQSNNVSLMLDWKVRHSDNNTCTVVIMHIHPNPHIDVLEPHKPGPNEPPDQPCPLGIYCLSDPIEDGERWENDLTLWSNFDPVTRNEKKAWFRSEFTEFIEESYISVGSNRILAKELMGSAKEEIIRQSQGLPFTITTHPLY